MTDYYEARYRALKTETEDLRDAANQALDLLGNLPLADQATQRVLVVVQQLEDALSQEQDEDEDA